MRVDLALQGLQRCLSLVFFGGIALFGHVHLVHHRIPQLRVKRQRLVFFFIGQQAGVFLLLQLPEKILHLFPDPRQRPGQHQQRRHGRQKHHCLYLLCTNDTSTEQCPQHRGDS